MRTVRTHKVETTNDRIIYVIEKEDNGTVFYFQEIWTVDGMQLFEEVLYRRDARNLIVALGMTSEKGWED